jgi:hypothetical protein
MSRHEFRDGARVRAVFEGKWGAGSLFLTQGRSFSQDSLGYATSVEEIKPVLPTTPGSVIRRGDANTGYIYRILGRGGKWKSGFLPAIAITDDNIHAYEVVFDAGTS